MRLLEAALRNIVQITVRISEHVRRKKPSERIDQIMRGSCPLLYYMYSEVMEANRVRSGSPESSVSDKSQSPTSRPRKRHRRGRHRRRWKPYSKMTADEKREVEARETARAAKREADLKGKPAAPWNTTQFLIDDRGSTEVRLPCPRISRTTSVESSCSDDEFFESSEEEMMEHGLFLEQDFESAYQEVAREHLQGMNKTELIQQCLELEEEVAELKEQGEPPMVADVAKSNATVSKLQQELEELQNDNQRLREQNEKLTNTNGTGLSKLQVTCQVNSC